MKKTTTSLKVKNDQMNKSAPSAIQHGAKTKVNAVQICELTNSVSSAK
jgi:hypothetical protein